MRDINTIERELTLVVRRLADLRERVQGRGVPIGIAQARTMFSELSKKKRALQREKAEQGIPRTAAGGRLAGLVTRASLLKAAAERRSLVIGESKLGAVNQIRELFKEIAETDNILNYATYYYGPNAATNIPVLSPMEDVDAYGEPTDSATAMNVSVDASAALSVTEIQPQAYARVLPITAEMLQMGAVDIESQIPDIFRQSYQRVMHKGMLTGDGTGKNMKGIFTSAKEAQEDSMRHSKVDAATVTVTELAGLPCRCRALTQASA